MSSLKREVSVRCNQFFNADIIPGSENDFVIPDCRWIDDDELDQILVDKRTQTQELLDFILENCMNGNGCNAVLASDTAYAPFVTIFTSDIRCTKECPIIDIVF